MGTANDERPSVLVAIDENGALNFHIQGFNPIELWGIAEQIKRHANLLDENARLAVMNRKPKLVVPG